MDYYKPEAKILIVDDLINNIKICASTLKENGYAIYIAQSGMNALNILEKVSPDLILLDVLMPEMDGYETCKQIKEKDQLKDIPVIFLTAKTEPEDILKGFESGGVDYITKPFNSMELLARVKTHISLKQSKDTIEKISQERKELIHILCHDLKNPLGAIKTFSDLILYEDAPDSYLNDINAAAKIGLELIDLIRDIEKVEDKSISLEPVSMKQSIMASIDSLKHKFDKKNIRLNIDDNIPEELYVWAEPISIIYSVLNNLLTNALKFSYPNNPIEIKCKVENESVVKLSIKDVGIGIPEKLKGIIFCVNQNTSRIGTDGEEGTGFGMPLVKKFMLAYGGDITLLSQDKKSFPQAHGTEFILTFKKVKR
jgi:signal transduction histidine kinase